MTGVDEDKTAATKNESDSGSDWDPDPDSNSEEMEGDKAFAEQAMGEDIIVDMTNIEVGVDIDVLMAELLEQDQGLVMFSESNWQSEE